MINLNLIYCELVGLLAVTEEKKKKKKEEANTAKQLHHVSKFVIDLLNDESRHDRVRQPILRGKTFIDLLPTIWLLLNGNDSRDCTTILDALILHWNSLKAHDSTKRVGAEFIGRLWLVSSGPPSLPSLFFLLLYTFAKFWVSFVQLPFQRSYHGAFMIRPGSPHRSNLVTWLIQSVPRYLWELHGKDAVANAMLLNLLRIVACQSDGLIIKDKVRIL